MSNMMRDGPGPSASSTTRSVTETEIIVSPENPAPVLRLQLTKPKNQKKVVWNADTVDNEHMNKKKSKCCCIYKKPTVFGESSSESEDECEHCFGHPEKRKKNCTNPNHNHDHSSDHENDSNPTTTTPPLSIETNP